MIGGESLATYLNLKKAIKSENSGSELKRSMNTYDDYVEEFVEGHVGGLYSDNLVETLTTAQVKDWLSNPDKYWKEISSYMSYMYYADGNIHQLYNLLENLPSYNFSIKVFDNTKNGYEKNVALIQQTMYKIKYRELARDIIRQLNVRGWVVCCWLGDKKKPYLYVFDNEYVFPSHREDGEWVAFADMAWFDEMEEEEREIVFNSLKGIISESDYNKYAGNNQDNQYVQLPIERTYCARINTLVRNQRLGLPNGVSYLYDYIHKQTLRNMETSIANKAIKSVAKLTIGDKENPYVDIGSGIRKKIVNQMKTALGKTVNPGSIPILTLPEFADLEFSKIDGLDGLNNDKFENIDVDIQKDLGFPIALLTGDGGNSATLKLAVTQLYKNVASMLELVENIFNKMMPLVLSKSYADNLYIEFEKTQPIETSDIIGVLQQLHSEGFAVKPILDMLPNVDFNEYIERSIYEQQTLKLYDSIKPPATSYTQSGGVPTKDTEAGRPAVDEGEGTEETIKSKDLGKQEQE